MPVDLPSWEHRLGLPHTDRMTMRRMISLPALMVVVALIGGACGDDAADETALPDGTSATTTVDQVEFDNPYAGYVSDLYDPPMAWHCRPDLTDDVCDGDLTATRVDPDGTLTAVPFEPATDAGVDCFYVYPTLDYAAEPGNHAFAVDNPLEPVTVQVQAAQFGSICDLYVPRYRQATIGSYDDTSATVDMFDLEPFNVAYADVLDAFSHYMATWNDGRPFVLLGHSQGSHHLIRLLQEEFDEVPALRGQLVSALLIGPTGRLRVPDGEIVGGTFADLPLCTSADETGCVVGFDSYAAAEPPTRPFESEDGDVPACVNPAELVDGDDRLTAGYFGRTVPGVTTFTEIIEDHYTATCVETADGRPYLEIDEAPPAGDTRRLTHIDSRVESSESLHTADYNFALGDLLAFVRMQIAALGGS